MQIRPIATAAEYRAAEALQRQVWGMSDDLEVVPYHLLVTAQENGGLLLGAFEGTGDQEQLIGLVFGFVGLSPEGHVRHCSHMAGVAPGYQNQNVGYRLKLAQRDHVLAQGLDLATWTFDPLQSRNAHLNFHKLGVVCRTYRRDLYGELNDALSGGMPTDRFKVEWHLEAHCVVDRLSGAWPGFALPALLAEGVPVIAGVEKEGLLYPPDRGATTSGATTKDAPEGGPFLVQFPSHIAALKARDMGLAHAWVETMRDLFEPAFAAGYTVVDCLYERGRSFYFLRQGGLP
ncbi:MAG: hypothetical protein JXM73_16020 [Anaerolineae bacterium]|nr:hypothetical protein [Anaerolineae bacterium]